MGTLRTYNYFEVEIDGVKRTGGSRSTPVDITVDGQCLDLSKSVAAEEEWTVWSASTEDALTNFDYLWVLSSLDIRLEFLVDETGGSAEKKLMFLVKANTPFPLFNDDSFTGDWATTDLGSAGLIDRVQIYNPSATTAAIVRVVMVT